MTSRQQRRLAERQYAKISKRLDNPRSSIHLTSYGKLKEGEHFTFESIVVAGLPADTVFAKVTEGEYQEAGEDKATGVPT